MKLWFTAHSKRVLADVVVLGIIVVLGWLVVRLYQDDQNIRAVVQIISTAQQQAAAQQHPPGK